MTKILTVFNAKNATKVRNIETNKVYTLAYCKVMGRGFMSNNDHELTDEQTGEKSVLGFHAAKVMEQYEVIETNGRTDLEDLYSEAVKSYNWSSMDPDRAARVMLHGYEAEIDKDLQSIPQEQHDEYIAEFKQHIRTVIARNSNVASAFVTGPARFNNRRNAKANNAYDRAVSDLQEWRERKIKSILRAIEAAKTPEQRNSEEWAKIEKDLLHTLSVIEKIDDGKCGGYSRSLFVNSITGKAETLARNGKADILERYLAIVTRYNEQHKKPAITARHKFWKLAEVLEKIKEQKEDRENRDSVEITCDSCTIVKNYGEDRLQLVFDGKPDYNTIRTLKANGFRWSPRFTAWQRQLTDNSYFAASRVTGVDVDTIRKAA